MRRSRHWKPFTGQPVVRKVRTAQGTVLDNVKAEQSDGKCNRKIQPMTEVAPGVKTSEGYRTGDGEMVR